MLLNSELLNTVRKRIDDSKKIPNYSNYVILPNEGLVYSLKNNRFIGSKNNKNGYYHIHLFNDNNEGWNTTLHRTIYIACYGEIPEGLEVNHIDENKSNNRIDNLNLMNHKENCNWGTLKGKFINRQDQSKTVGAYKDGVLVMTFQSIRETGRNGFDFGTVYACCNGKRKTHKGYEWKYIETEKVA